MLLSSLRSCVSHHCEGGWTVPHAIGPFHCHHSKEPVSASISQMYLPSARAEALSLLLTTPFLPLPTGADDPDCSFIGTCVPEGLKEKLGLEETG